MSFFRRFTEIPSNEVLDQIEGVTVADLGQPARVDGVQSGLACIVGEFPDVTYATEVDASGNVTSKYTPVMVSNTTEMTSKLGGPDSTIGDFGDSGGNGYVTIIGKKWPGGFVAVPINLAGSKGVRLWRDLPTNRSLLIAEPIVPVSPGFVPAGTEFISGLIRVKSAKRVVFTAERVLASGLTASMAVAASAVSQIITVAGSDVTATATVGRILVCGVLGGAAANQGQYRIISSVLNGADTDITVQKMDGSAFALVLAATQPWRIHEYSDADTGDVALATASGYRIPARPLTNNTGGATAGTIAATTNLTAADPAAAGSATSWESLSGLTLRPMVTDGLTFDPNIHAPNAVAHATIDAEYVSAMRSLQELKDPQQKFTIGPVCSRTSTTIRSTQRSVAMEKSKYAMGCVCPIAPELTVQDLDNAATDVALTRDEQVIYCFPGVQQYIPEFVGTAIMGADGVEYTDGYVDVPSDGLLASIMSVLPPEHNPAQETSTVKSVTAAFAGFQRGMPTTDINWYIRAKSLGICAPIWNSTLACLVFQSGITSSLENGKTSIARRRYNFFVDDSLAAALTPYNKRNQSPTNEEAALAAVEAFLYDQQSPDDASRSRCRSYRIDTSQNTDTTRERGYFFIGWSVKMYASNDSIVGVSRIGFTVDTSE